MNLRSLFTVTILAAALPALAAPTCNPPQIVTGNTCTLTAALGWGIAGLGTDSILTIYVPPSASGPVDIEVTGLNSNLGSSYTGYFGFKGNLVGQTQSGILTLSNIVAGGDNSIGLVPPRSLTMFQITQVCWDPTCTAAAPAGAVPNMFSMQLTLSSPNTTDINPNEVQLTARFLDGSGHVTSQEQEPALHTNSPVSIIPGVNLGATPATRYVYNGSAVTLPYDVLSISNFSNPNPITGTAILLDGNGNNVATATIPAIPSNGAAGFLVIGRFAGDPLGLFPSSIVLPAGSDGVFHGNLVVSLNGLTATGLNIVLSQEFNGNSLLNLFVFHSPIP
jgi:hypothetical protein